MINPAPAGKNTVASLSLPAGKYLIMAMGNFHNSRNFASQDNTLGVECFLEAGGARSEIFPDIGGGFVVSASLQLIATLSQNGATTLKCYQRSFETESYLTVYNLRLDAVKIG